MLRSSSDTPGLGLGPCHVKLVVNEVPVGKAFLPVLWLCPVSTFRQYYTLIFISVLFRITGVRRLEIFKNYAVSGVGEHRRAKNFDVVSFRMIKVHLWICTSCIRRRLL
jgi:hypothetical protein